MSCCITGDCIRDLISRCGIDINVSRFSSGSYDENGRWVDGSQVIVPIKAVIQPVTGEDLQRLDDSRDVSDVISIWTIDDLYGANITDKTQPDKLEYKGKEYEIYFVRDWDVYIKAIAIKTQSV